MSENSLKRGHRALPDGDYSCCIICGDPIIWAYWLTSGAMWVHRAVVKVAS